MPPNQKSAISQTIVIEGVGPGQAHVVKMRWKASYKVAENLRQEQGEVPSLGIL